MDSVLSCISFLRDDNEKLEHYKRAVSTIISSFDEGHMYMFIDHVLSDKVPWAMSRQLLQAIAEEMSSWEVDKQFNIVNYCCSKVFDWKLNEVFEIFDSDHMPDASPTSSSPEEDVNSLEDGNEHNSIGDKSENDGQGGVEEDVRPPLPVVRDTLYNDAVLHGEFAMGYPQQPQGFGSEFVFHNFEEETRRHNAGKSSGAIKPTADGSQENLASIYRPPFHLSYRGSFEKAKSAASMEDKWLIVNVQSAKEFTSYMLNRDTWGNEIVAQTIRASFIFWQIDDETFEGKKVRFFYKLDSMPVVLVIEPITGQKMRSWTGMVEPDGLLQDLVTFMDRSPKDHFNLSKKRSRPSSLEENDEISKEDQRLQRTLDASSETINSTIAVASNVKNDCTANGTSPTKKLIFTRLPEEPKGDKNLFCGVAIRFPDGRRVQRNFLKTDPIQLLWSFCESQIEEARRRPFRLTEAMPGGKRLDYESKMTLEESGLANSLLSVAWE